MPSMYTSYIPDFYWVGPSLWLFGTIVSGVDVDADVEMPFDARKSCVLLQRISDFDVVEVYIGF